MLKSILIDFLISEKDFQKIREYDTLEFRDQQLFCKKEGDKERWQKVSDMLNEKRR